MSDLPKEVALKILALVDEIPSEPFSFERKQIENRIADMLFAHGQQANDELDDAFFLGLEEGRRQTEEEFEERIGELEEQIEILKEELRDMESQLDQRFAEGYETASREVNIVETLKFD